MIKKTGKKDFAKGLNSLIQSTVEPEIEIEAPIRAQAPEEETPEPEKKKKEKGAEKERQITITIPPSLKRTIKKYCANNEITIKDLFINSVTRYMKVEEV